MRPPATWLLSLVVRWLPGGALIVVLCFPSVVGTDFAGRSAKPAPPRSARFETSVSQPRKLRAGSVATVRVRVANTGEVADRYEARIVPPIPGRVVKRALPFELRPAHSHGATMRWRLPQGYAGRTHVQVHVTARAAAAHVRRAAVVVTP